MYFCEAIRKVDVPEGGAHAESALTNRREALVKDHADEEIASLKRELRDLLQVRNSRKVYPHKCIGFDEGRNNSPANCSNFGTLQRKAYRAIRWQESFLSLLRLSPKNSEQCTRF